MRRFKNILAVTSDAVGSDQVLDRAAHLARQNNAMVTLLEVIEDGYLPPDAISERQRRLSRMIESLRADGLDIRPLIRRGKQFMEVTQQVMGNQHDLVMMAAEAPGGFRDLLFGSNSLHLMRKCPCPVWVLKPGESNKFNRILAAIDVHSDNEGRNAISHKIMQLATSVAEIDEAELHVVHAWDVIGADGQTLRSEVHDDTRKDIIVKHLRLAEQRVEEFLNPYTERFERLQLHIERGEAWQAITAVEQSLDIDLVVMGTLDNASVPGFFIGTTAETVLRQVNSSVLTVKPEGFVSPILLEEQALYA